MAELLFQSKQEKLNDGSLIITTKILGAIDGTTVRQFEDKLIGFFNQGVKNLILIFSDVKYINSTGMGLLVKLADKFQEGGGDIKLVGVPEKVIALFDMLGLLSLFKIYDTEEDAMDAISAGGKGASADAAPRSAPAAPAAPAVPPPAPAHAAHPTPPPPPAPSHTQSKMQAPPPPRPAAPVPPPPVPQPAPQPAPQPMPQPSKSMAAEDMGLGEGLTIDPAGGFEISAEPEKSVPVSWPYDSPCSHCGGTIQFAAKGNYQCPRCSSYLSIDDYGQQTVHASVSSKLVEFKCPSDATYISAAQSMVNALATQVGFTAAFCEEIDGALSDALSIAIEKSSGPAESFQITAIADSAEMVMGIRSLNPFLVQGGPRDRRLPVIAKKVDRLEVFPLPNKGQLLKITKRRK